MSVPVRLRPLALTAALLLSLGGCVPNPEAEARAAQQFLEIGDALNELRQTTGALSGTTWVGPARDQFQGEWEGTFRSALTRLNEAFGQAGNDCINRSADLQRVMGAR